MLIFEYSLSGRGHEYSLSGQRDEYSLSGETHEYSLSDQSNKYSGKCIYIHIPKNCGRYIRKQIYNNFECFNVNPGYPYPVSYKVSNDSGYHLHDRYLQLKDLADNFITFVRNPYHRVISFFYDVIFYQDVFITRSPVIDFIRNPLEILKTKNMEDLINLLKTEFKKYILDIDNTSLIPQYNYLIDENENIPQNMTIYKLEEPETFAHLNFNDFNLKEYNLSEYFFSGQSNEYFLSGQGHEYFDSELLEIVNNKYQKDFELFNYSKLI